MKFQTLKWSAPRQASNLCYVNPVKTQIYPHVRVSQRADSATREKPRYSKLISKNDVILTRNQCDNARPKCGLCVKHDEECMTLGLDENETFSRQFVILP
jgi:DNA polymerase II large subunit